MKVKIGVKTFQLLGLYLKEPYAFNRDDLVPRFLFADPSLKILSKSFIKK